MRNILLQRIFEKAPTQKKKIERFLDSSPAASMELDGFLLRYEIYMRQNNIGAEALADAYLEMVNEVIEARLEFVRTGAYPAQSASLALGAVYQNPAVMKHYMLGLALSYFLWEHHRRLLQFFRASVEAVCPIGWALEVGCGHGLFLAELLDRAPELQGLDVVDLSPTSIEMASSLVQCLGQSYATRSHFFLQDLYTWKAPRLYSFITLGEVLEHVEDPQGMLKALAPLLSPGGHLYITTCANCPAIDHVYHFKNVEEIRAVARNAGYKIVSELVAPSVDRSDADLLRFQIDISYAALLAKAD